MSCNRGLFIYLFAYLLIFNPHLRMYLILETVGGEGERERENEGERNINWLPPVCTLTRDPT